MVACFASNSGREDYSRLQLKPYDGLTTRDFALLKIEGLASDLDKFDVAKMLVRRLLILHGANLGDDDRSAQAGGRGARHKPSEEQQWRDLLTLLGHVQE